MFLLRLCSISSAVIYLIVTSSIAIAQQVPSFGGNAQHTSIYGESVAAQDINQIHWQATIDTANTASMTHYGAPVITANNTVLAPVKTTNYGDFQVQAFNGVNGSLLYTLVSDYVMPQHNWLLTYQPGLANGPNGERLYYPGMGGTLYYIDRPGSISHTTPVQIAFYGIGDYNTNKSGFNGSVFINTPIVSDAYGNIFFGFRVQGTAPAPLNTTQSGFARIARNGSGTYVLAGTAAQDPRISRDSHNSAPALSNDGKTLYVAVKGSSTAYYGYLLALDATTLATKYRRFLRDPRSNGLNNAGILDDATASPTVGPDGDIYFGVMANPQNGSRGFLLHFSADLQTIKTPGGFGWDYTAGIVPRAMVPSYSGASQYLIVSKYNNYAHAGADSGDGVNRIALLDPNAPEVDAHRSSNGMPIMREVMTVIGSTPDPANQSTNYPNAVREWCINSPAVDVRSHSVFVPSEDGSIYRWNLSTNALSQFLKLGAGVGEPYVPTVIGPDGTVYTLNGGTLFALGASANVSIKVVSTTPDVRMGVVGQPVTFTATVANLSGIHTQRGTVTFTDTVYSVKGGKLQSTQSSSSAIPLDSASKASTHSTLPVGTHFVTAAYSGNKSNAGLIQRVHAGASTTTVTVTPSSSVRAGQQVTITATVAAVLPATGTPTGMVVFLDGTAVLAQGPVNGNGVASIPARLGSGPHTITVVYASDTRFAASSGSATVAVH